MRKKQSKPAPQTISAFCGYCQRNDAEIILPNHTLACKDCARKQGYEINFNITPAKLVAIRKKITKAAGVKVPAWVFGIMLGLNSTNKESLNSWIYNMEAGRQAIPQEIAEEALRIEQLGEKDLKFLIEQAEISL